MKIAGERVSLIRVQRWRFGSMEKVLKGEGFGWGDKCVRNRYKGEVVHEKDPGDTKGWRRLGWCDVEGVVKERGMRLSQVRRVRSRNRGEKGNVVRVGCSWSDERPTKRVCKCSDLEDGK